MQAIEAIPLFRTRPGLASGGAAKEAPAATFSLDFEPDPAPIAEPTEPAPLDAGQLAYYKQFVGKIVSDEAMTNLYLAAHRNGFRLTSEAQGRWWQECDYKVTGAYR